MLPISFSNILYESMHSLFVFSLLFRSEVVQQILRCDYNFNDPIWQYISKEAQNFVKQLLEYVPDKRLTAEKANNSPWFQYEHTDVDDDEFKKIIGNSVVEFHSDSSYLRKLGLVIIAHQSPTSEILKLRSAFEELDTDNDGILTIDEFKSVFKKHGYSDSEAESSYSSMVSFQLYHIIDSFRTIVKV